MNLSAGSVTPSVGDRTLSEVDGLLSRAAAELRLGLDQGIARIGPYTLVSVVGEGGFGTVWLASQEEPIRRLVALKLLRRDPGSKMVLSRFDNERQTLSRMDHVNVASVLDAGVTEDGRPWFVMPFIDGLPINALCDERKMRPRDRVQLFIEVCDGVQHAHQKGIIHRDLKPGNILVTRNGNRPVAKVIDFGVAKALDPADVVGARTSEGQRLGTPQYMPPEQWMHGASVADVRSDVYALGVVLGELLAGGPATRLPRTPLDVPQAIAPCAWLAQTQSTDPALLARVAAARSMGIDELTSAIRGDLDAIVRRATAQHPEDRYGTAAALGDDLRRWLEGRAVAARLLEPWEQLSRAVRRNKLTSVLAALAAVLLVGSAVVWITSSANERLQRSLTESARKQSEMTFELSRDMITDLVTQQRLNKDPRAGKATFDRIEKTVDRIATEDPLTAGRLAAIVARGHLSAWQQRSSFNLLRRSFDRVLQADPSGSSIAYQELAPEFLMISMRAEQAVAQAIAPGVMLEAVRSGNMLTSSTQGIVKQLLNNRMPWPFYVSNPDGQEIMASSQWYAAMIADPLESACVLATLRIRGMSRMDELPGRIAEANASLLYLRSHVSSVDPDLLRSEVEVCLMHGVGRSLSDDETMGFSLRCLQIEHIEGAGSVQTVNAFWNLCCCYANRGDFDSAYISFSRILWPDYLSRDPRDGLRDWYLAYFAPVAFRSGHYDDAYAVAVTQLSDRIAAGQPTTDFLSAQSARTLAGVLAIWGDEVGAKEVEEQFKVTRADPCGPGW